MRPLTIRERDILNGVKVEVTVGITRIPIRGNIKLVLSISRTEKFIVVSLAIHDNKSRVVELNERDLKLSGMPGRVDNGILSFRLPQNLKNFVIEAWTT